MPDLLLELFSEEIPARMQRRAAEDLRKLVTDALVERGFLYEDAAAYATPRRLTLTVAGLTPRGRDVREERKGPRVGAPEAAITGFLKSAGLASITEATVERDPKKGEFYVARTIRPGRPTPEVLAEVVPDVIRGFPWPKSMRWGPASAQGASLRWVRPLHAITCTFGPETEEPEVVRFAVGDVESGATTYGHRFLAPGPIAVRRFDDYVTALERARVVLDPERRKNVILHDARDLAFAQGLTLVEDPGLLEEVAGLVEWPVVLMGGFDEGFLDIPPEVIRATIRTNQKCFVLARASGALSNRFVLVSNLEAVDGGRAIVAGNERVVRARLSDAKFFWDTDRRTPLEERLPRLAGIVFHEKLGSQAERVERIAAFARELAPVAGADPSLAERAARLAKADLVTEMVGEFPELQGLMGRYYAAAQGEADSVAAAVEEHYKPLGPSDRVPADPVSVAVALADKLDTLVGFWAIDERPTGSKDPYSLRRAALGVIRLILERGLRLPLTPTLTLLAAPHAATLLPASDGEIALPDEAPATLPHAIEEAVEPRLTGADRVSPVTRMLAAESTASVVEGLLSFFADRLKVLLRDQGARHDLIDAVFALPGQDDLLLVVRRVEALGRFLDTEDGRNLLAATKRAANILRIEEKKDGVAYEGPPDPDLIAAGAAEERAFAAALDGARAQAAAAVAGEDYEGAMRALSGLRAPVDAFFDRVTVNAADPGVRANRLRLLNALRAATREVADFSRIEG